MIKVKSTRQVAGMSNGPFTTIESLSITYIRQTAKVRFKFRICQNRKWADKNSSKQFLWIKNCVKQLICAEKMISTWQGKTWPRGANSRRFAIKYKTCNGVRVTSCRHPFNILGNIADDDFFSKRSYASRYSNCSGFKKNWKKENSNTRRDMLLSPPPLRLFLMRVRPLNFLISWLAMD